MAFDSSRGQTVLFGGVESGASFDLGDTWQWNGATWVEAFPVAGPAARSGQVMAYDSARQVTVLFSGDNGVSDTWEWDGTTWWEQFPVNSPQARRWSAMVFDQSRGVMVLFGGYGEDGGGFLNDTWEWDGTNWEEQAPATSPPGREFHAMAYDSSRHVTVLFAGADENGNDYDDTWEWNGVTWSQAQPASSPPARSSFGIAYDSARGMTVAFGGFYTDGSQDGDLSDTWEWDGTVWTQVTPATVPPQRDGLAMAYDSSRQVVVMFGGDSQEDTWEWNGETWAQLSDTTAPPPRAESALIYDSARQVTVLFGGTFSDQNTFGDTWTWDGSRWTLLAPATVPPARFAHAMDFDSARRVSVLFGGINTLAAAVNDTWEWNGADWTDRTPANGATSPPARCNHAQAYDSSRGVTVLFGGQETPPNGGDGALNDTWEWDGTAWSQLTPAASPPVRASHALAYDPNRGVTVLFGGMDESVALDDTWEWNGTLWTQRLPPVSPSARYGHVMAYDSERGRTVLFGGAPAEGPVPFDDTWEWDGMAWLQVAPATSPPACTESAFSFDSTRGVAVLFGGLTDPGEWGPDLGQTWELHDEGASSVLDAGPEDAGPLDAGPLDAGPLDAGPPDAGPPDAGPLDAGPAGPLDAGPLDAGPPDAGPPDAGPPDAGPPLTYQVTPSGDGREVIDPSGAQTVMSGNTQVFVLVATTGYVLSQGVGGTCPTGFWSWDTYETGAIAADCSVSFSAMPNTVSYEVAPSGDGAETIDPAETQTVLLGNEQAFAVTPTAGHTLSQAVGGSCPPGSWSGNNYTTGAISGGCSVVFSGTAIDNCGTDAGGCVPAAACADTGPGSNTCACPANTVGDGTLAGTGCSPPSPDAGATCGCTLSNGCSNCPDGLICDVSASSPTGVSEGPCAIPDYTDNGDGTVTDNVTGLVWQQTPSTSTYDWNSDGGSGSAQGYCENPSLNGAGWRVPTLAELFSLVDLGSVPWTIDAAAFPNGGASVFWTASQVGGSPSLWCLDFSSGAQEWGWYDSTIAVRCVRGADDAGPGATGVGACAVTPAGDGSETISPNQPLELSSGSTQSFTVTAASGYMLSQTVGGTCPAGSWSGSNYTTGQIVADCSVSFTASAIDNCSTNWGGCVPSATCSQTGPGTNTCMCSWSGVGDGTVAGTGCAGGQPDAGTFNTGDCGGTMEQCCGGTECNSGLTCETAVCASELPAEGWVEPVPADGSGGSDAGPAAVPPARCAFAMAYDSDRGVTVLFGGTNGPGAAIGLDEVGGADMNDTWEWDGAAWAQVSVATSPTARAGHAMAYDSGRGVTVLFAGDSGNDTWEWNGTAWTQRTAIGATGSPSSRTGHAMVYDSARGLTVLFGGSASGSPMNDTWEWNGIVWTRASSGGPPARSLHAMAYDSARGMTVLFGGWNNAYGDYGNALYGSDLNDTWEWDGTTWAEREPATSPTARQAPAMAYDSRRGVSILFGGDATPAGYDLNGGMMNTTWEWKGTAWIEMVSTKAVTTPLPRAWHAMAYDSANGVTVLFGGQEGTGANLNDVWLFSPSIPGLSCDPAVCMPSACASGYATCGGSPDDLCATNLSSDTYNCGSCGRWCGYDPVCQGGACCYPSGPSSCQEQDLPCCDPNSFCWPPGGGCVSYVSECGRCDNNELRCSEGFICADGICVEPDGEGCGYP